LKSSSVPRKIYLSNINVVSVKILLIFTIKVSRRLYFYLDCLVQVSSAPFLNVQQIAISFVQLHFFLFSDRSILHIHLAKEGNDIQLPLPRLHSARNTDGSCVCSSDLHGFSRLDFGNALTAQIERELHTNINSRVKISTRTPILFLPNLFPCRKHMFLCTFLPCNAGRNVASHKRRLLAKGRAS